MAYSRNNAASNSPADSWKAAAFINLYITRTDGTRAKVGAIPLKADKRFDAALIERLQKEDGAQAFMDALAIDFQMVDNKEPINIGF